VAEMLVKGTSHMSHIFHMHVNPFQLQDVVPAQNRAGNYFQRGDWHDTIRDVMSSHGHHHGHGHLRTRFQTDTFTGTVPIHCHYLVHEDQGMMTTIRIDGPEGTTFADAERLDPHCYRSAAPEVWPRVTLPMLSVRQL